MSSPETPEPVKLITSIFSSEKALLEEVMKQLSELAGPTDWVSPKLYFDRTRYYEKEMGWPLHRRFVSFNQLISPETIIDIKLAANRIEKAYLSHGNRRVNIDPGYISLERLILATGKNYIHRVYLGRGIYADLTLIFKRGGFIPLEWTYRDYGDPEMIGYFNEVRNNYLIQLRGGDTVD